MKKISIRLFIILLLLFSAQRLSAQKIYNYTALNGAGDFYGSARFSILITDSVQFIKGVYLVFAGNDNNTEKAVSKNEYNRIRENSGFAILAITYVWGDEAWEIPPMGLYRTVPRALHSFAVQSSHPELEYAPIFLEGYSASGWFAYFFSWWRPDIVLGFNAQKFTPPAFNVGLAKNVPGYFFYDHLDSLGPTAAFELNRPKGAVWTIAFQQNSFHFQITDRDLLDNYFFDIMKLRLPSEISTGKPVELKTIDQTKGWLGDRISFEIASYDSFKGDKSMASWMPGEDAAIKWQNFVRRQTPQGEAEKYVSVNYLPMQQLSKTDNRYGKSLAQANASFTGESGEDNAGYSIASAGDVNGDGLEDFLIGAPGKDGGDLSTTNEGITYLILGRKDAAWGENFSLSNADASFIGEAGNNYSGSSVASAGDVNGDGLSDFIIGAKGYRNERNNSGMTYLILGRKKADWGKGFSLANADASFVGENAMDLSGTHVSSVGDVNGDGLDDFIIGADGKDFGNEKTDAGIAYLILGRKKADWGLNFKLSQADASFSGESALEGAGFSVSQAGDVNGDGLKDFLIGTRLNFENDALLDSKTYLILGRKAADWGRDFDLSHSDASFIGENKFDLSGYSIAPAGDVNGDGLDDFLIGARDNTGNEHFSGQAYLILGRAKADWGLNFSLSKADASFSGEGKFDAAGFSVSSVGDVNKDGLSDFIIGAPNNSSSAELSGKAYLIFGRKNASWGMHYKLSEADIIFNGEEKQDFAGFSVAKAGDVNGDGFGDFLIGALRNSTKYDGVGKVYLITGGGVNAVNSGVQPPSEFALLQNYPNPFNPSTIISFELPKSSNVTITIYNIQGQEIRHLAGGNYSSGRYDLSWNGKDNNGQTVSAGIYFIQMRSPEYLSVRKAILMK